MLEAATEVDLQIQLQTRVSATTIYTHRGQTHLIARSSPTRSRLADRLDACRLGRGMLLSSSSYEDADDVASPSSPALAPL